MTGGTSDLLPTPGMGPDSQQAATPGGAAAGGAGGMRSRASSFIPSAVSGTLGRQRAGAAFHQRTRCSTSLGS